MKRCIFSFVNTRVYARAAKEEARGRGGRYTYFRKDEWRAATVRKSYAALLAPAAAVVWLLSAGYHLSMKCHRVRAALLEREERKTKTRDKRAHVHARARKASVREYTRGGSLGPI